MYNSITVKKQAKQQMSQYPQYQNSGFQSFQSETFSFQLETFIIHLETFKG